MKEGDEMLFKFLLKLNDGNLNENISGGGGEEIGGGKVVDREVRRGEGEGIYISINSDRGLVGGENKLKFNLKDNTNLTPLLKGIENGNGLNLFELLFRNEIDFKCKDNYKRNFFHLICHYERIDILNLFLDSNKFEIKKFEKFKDLILEFDKKGSTCLHISIKKFNFNFTKKLFSFILLLNLTDIILNLKNSENLTPFELSCKIGKDLTNQLKIENEEQFKQNDLISIKKNLNENLKVMKLLSN